MRVLVTGARGQLGSALMGALARRGHDAVGFDLPELDITDPRQLESALKAARPDSVVNCAAWTDVDGAEAHPAEAERVNALGPALLARLCSARSVRLLHMSTDFVFAGDGRSPIPEDAVPAPLGAYGRTKLAGEEAVRREATDHLVVRTSWLYGGHGPNFVLTMLRAGSTGGALRVVDDQTGSPTWTGHLAPSLVTLLEKARRGTYHLTGGGEVSWCGFARAIFEAAAMVVQVDAVTSAEYRRPARRPSYSVLDNAAWRADGEAVMPHWRDGLRQYLAELGRS